MQELVDMGFVCVGVCVWSMLSHTQYVMCCACIYKMTCSRICVFACVSLLTQSCSAQNCW